MILENTPNNTSSSTHADYIMRKMIVKYLRYIKATYGEEGVK